MTIRVGCLRYHSMPESFSALKDLARVWIGSHRPQFLVLAAIAGCLALIAVIMIILIKSRQSRPKEIPELKK